MSGFFGTITLKQLDVMSIGGALGGAMLGSSCCAIQLVLNYFSIGCAGFAILDPYRPIFLAMSASSFGTMLYFNHQTGRPLTSFRNVFSLALVVGLALLPKLVDYVNTPSPPALADQVFEVDLSGMKCVGCANAVHNALNTIDGVVQNRVVLEEQAAEIYVRGDKPLTDDALEAALGDLGFGGKIKSARRPSEDEATRAAKRDEAK